MACISPPAPVCDLIGHEAALAAMDQARSLGRCPHAVLISGPSGIGKARLALEIAERVLSSRDSVRAGSHPDCRWIARGEADKSDIPVDSVRKLIHFFAHKSGRGGYKLAVIDAIDDLNRFGLNALLKTLEEPHGDALLLLVRHGRRAIPATIASRCMRLRLSPLTNAQTQQVLAHTGVEAGLAEELATWVPGRPGLVMRLASEQARKARQAAMRALQEGTSLSAATLASLSGAAGRSPESLEAIGRTLCQHVRDAACTAPQAGQAGAWASAYMRMGKLLAEQQEFMLDPGQTIASILRELARAQRLAAETSG